MEITKEKYIEKLFELIPDKGCQQILAKLQENGYDKMSVSTLERLKKKERDIKMEEFLLLCRIYHLKPEQIIGTSDENQKRVSLNHTGFVTEADAEEFKGYLGEYNCWFCSTALEEQGNLIKGKLELKKAEAGHTYCEASVLLYLKGNSNKVFSGYAVVAKKLSAIWVLVTEQNTGDFAVILFRHRYFNSECACRVGAVMTISAGEYKQPVFQKIFLTRSNLKEEAVKQIFPVLKTDLSILRIAEEHWKHWSAANPRIAEKIPKIRECTFQIDLNAMLEREVPMEDIIELLNFAQNEEMKRVGEVDDRLAFLVNQEVCRRGRKKNDSNCTPDSREKG